MFKQIIKSETLRRRTSWVIAAILILPFVLFFHASGQAPTKGPGGAAGVLFGKEVSWETYQAQRFWLMRQLASQMGELGASMDDALAAFATQAAWERLMLVEEASRRKLRVDDEALARFIRTISAFQDQGQFREERYRQFVGAMGLTPQLFERLMRNDLLVDKLMSAVKETVAVSDAEVQAAYLRDREQAKALVLFFDPVAYTEAAAAQITDDDTQRSYDTNPEAVRVPEQLRFDYAGASRSELLGKVEISDAELQAAYEDRAGDFALEDGTPKPFEGVKDELRRRIADERVSRQLTALVMDLEDDLEAKRSFEEIVQARALSQHAAGPVAAGSSWVPDGPDPAVLQAAAQVPAGSMSEVVKTDGGVYLARVTERIPAMLPPLDEVRAAIRDRLVQERTVLLAKSAAVETRQKLADLLKAGHRFEEAMLTSAPLPARLVTITRTGAVEPIGQAPAVNAAAFEGVLGQLSEPVEAGSGFALVRPEERMPADLSGFEAAKAQVREETLQRQQGAALQSLLEEVRRRAKLKSFVEDAKRGNS